MQCDMLRMGSHVVLWQMGWFVMVRGRVWLVLFVCGLFCLFCGVACEPSSHTDGKLQDGGESSSESNREAPQTEGLPQEAIVAERGPEQEAAPSKETKPKDISLLDHTKWVATAPEKDPFRALWPELGAERCQGDFAWHLDKDALELDTEICNFITLEQPMLASIRKGDMLKLGLWHVDLYSDKDVEAVVTIRAGETNLWSKTIPIPSRANYYEPRFEAPADIAQGATLSFHLHNHGLNSWYLLYLVVSP